MSSKQNKTIRQAKKLLDKAEPDAVNKVYEELVYNADANKWHRGFIWYSDKFIVPMLVLVVALALPHVRLFMEALFIANLVIMVVWSVYRCIIPRILRTKQERFWREWLSLPFIALSAMLIGGGLPMLAFAVHAAVYEGWYDDWGSIARCIPGFISGGILIMNSLSARKMFWSFWRAAR